MHICHFNSTSLQDIERAAQLVRTAQSQGLKVTVEAYPYGTGSTVIGATFFADPDFPGPHRQRVQRRRDAAHRPSLRRPRRAAGGTGGRPPASWCCGISSMSRRTAGIATCWTCRCCSPGGAIASDAIPWMINGASYAGDAWPLPEDAVSHPRSAGTFTRFLRHWVRERQAVTLMEGLAKCTLVPAQILQPSTAALANKARLQPGCDADIVVFDFDALTDRAEFKAMNRPATGMRHVLVHGTPVISDGELVLDARPGRPVRRPVTQR